ncbi:hypothetical protein [Plastoroseomonas arctica]|uniref:Uncharacterized protein n=1 Tax=Plastoroseomonas arctica TaxID=1509237 RepID=A0AAF1JTZ3_9PROT|nr:hypothetical protein [Plastoroseomonas arctica]MBR0653452.1 hypothetical protein [Plastoroseomonas arctica]
MKTNPRSVASPGPDTGRFTFARLAAALRWRRPPPPASPTAPAPLAAPAESLALMLRVLAEEMLRLKHEGAEVSRSLAEAAAAGRQMHDAVREANARLAESASLNTATAEALCLLPGIVNRQADRIDSLSDKAEALLSQPAADAGLQATIARLEAARPDPALAQGVIAATERLEALIATLEQRADPSLLDQAAQRIDAASQSLEALPAAMEARLDTAAAATLGEVEAKIARVVAKLSRLATTAQGGLDARLGTGPAWPPEAATPIRRVS